MGVKLFGYNGKLLGPGVYSDTCDFYTTEYLSDASGTSYTLQGVTMTATFSYIYQGYLYSMFYNSVAKTWSNSVYIPTEVEGNYKILKGTYAGKIVNTNGIYKIFFRYVN